MCKIEDLLVWFMLLLCGIRDWRKREIPTLWLIIMSVVIGILLLCFGRNMLISRVTGGLLGVLLFLISKWTKEAIGYGDSWLILLLGVYLGGFKTLQLLFFASVIAGVFALIYLWKRKWKKNITIPFVPFMTVAYLGVVFL